MAILTTSTHARVRRTWRRRDRRAADLTLTLTLTLTYGVLGGDAAGEQSTELTPQRGDEGVHADEAGDGGEARDQGQGED